MRPAPHAGPGPPLDGAEAVRAPSIEESIMAHIFFPLPSRDFDPTEVGVTWRVLTAAGHGVSFATPDGKAGAADPIMITGRGLDPWSPIPLIGRITVIGRMLRANKDARRAYAEMIASPAFRSPRSEERRVGQECVSTCRSRWSPSSSKKKQTHP